MRLPRSIFTLLACLLIGSAATSALTAATRNPTPPALTTFMRDGGWCWYQDPRAIIAHGKLIIGGVSGQNGDLKVSVYDLTANRDLGTVVLHPQFQVDDHDVPALYARPDGSILAVYAKHGNERIHYTRISSPDDYLQWGPEQQFVHNYDAKPGVTYMNLYYLEQEVLLYNFFRDGPTYNPSFMTSSDHGQTWGNRTHFISDEVEGRQRPYARYLQRDANTVGITFTDAHPATSATVSTTPTTGTALFIASTARRSKTSLPVPSPPPRLKKSIRAAASPPTAPSISVLPTARGPAAPPSMRPGIQTSVTPSI